VLPAGRYAWYKLYTLARGYNKNLTPSDVQMLASNVLLSALSILPYGQADLAQSEADAEQEKERGLRMASLLGFSVVWICPRFNRPLLFICSGWLRRLHSICLDGHRACQ
jgi:hypothetical protein